MDHFRRALIAFGLLAGLCGSAGAAYSSLGMGSLVRAQGQEVWNLAYQARSSGEAFKFGTNGAVIDLPWVGSGFTVKLPASVKVTSDAAALASVVAPFVVSNPFVAAAASVALVLAPVGLQWLSDQGYWGKMPDGVVQSDGWGYGSTIGPHYDVFPSVQAACAFWIPTLNSDAYTYTFTGNTRQVGGAGGYWQCSDSWTGVSSGSGWDGQIAKVSSSCPAGWYYTSSGACVKTLEYTKQSNDEAAAIMKGLTWTPDAVAEIAQKTPLPIDKPKLNPDSAGNPQPLKVPQGNPVPNPKYDPGQPESKTNPKLVQPTVVLTPANTDQSPLRVDVGSENVPVLSGETPKTDPYTPDSPDDGSTPNDQPDVCKDHPDISGCAPLGEPDDVPDLTTKDQGGPVTPKGSFGPDGGSCPAPQAMGLSFGSESLSWEPLCQFAIGIRPIVLGIAWLSAAFIFIGFGRGES